MKKSFTLRILSTSDIHGSILPIYYGDNSRVNRGMTKIASIIKEKRTENTILIDVGDAIQGSPLMYFHKTNPEKYDNPVAKVFNYLEYDYFVPGNHDFNYGQKYLKSFLEQLNALPISGNILSIDDNKYLCKPYDIIHFENGPTICIIGMTTDYIPNWENPKNIQNLKFENVIETVKKTIREVKKHNKIDAFILAYHGGFERNFKTDELEIRDTGENVGSKLLAEVEELDVLLTGHQHRKIALVKNNTSIIQPGCNAEYLGLVDLNFRFEGSNWTITNRSQELISVEKYQSDPDCENLIKEIEHDNQSFLDLTIGVVENDNLEVKDPFLARLKKHPIVTFINSVQLDTTKADLSATSLANDITGFKKNISIRNVLSTYVYPNTLVVLEITGKILKEYLEKNAEYFVIENNQIVSNPRFSIPKMEHYNYDMVDGISYTIKVSNAFGNRITSLTYKNQNVKPEDKFSICLNNYRATGGGDFDMLSDLPVIKEIPFDIAELLIEYIRNVKTLSVKDVKNIHISI